MWFVSSMREWTWIDTCKEAPVAKVVEAWSERLFGNAHQPSESAPGPIDGRGPLSYTLAMAPEQHSSQAGNLDRRAAQKRAARREDSRRLEAGESPEDLQAENSAVPPGSFVGARIANLWQAMGE